MSSPFEKIVSEAIDRQQSLLDQIKRLESDFLSLMNDLHNKETMISNWAVEIAGRVEHIDRSVQEAINYSRGGPPSVDVNIDPQQEQREEQPPRINREAMLKRLRERNETAP